MSISAACFSGLDDSKTLPQLPSLRVPASGRHSFSGLQVQSAPKGVVHGISSSDKYKNEVVLNAMRALGPDYFLIGPSIPPYKYIVQAVKVSEFLNAEFIPFLIGDIYSGSRDGYTYRKMHDSKKESWDGLHDHSGFLTLYAQMHLIALKHPEEEIRFNLSLNSTTQLNKLAGYLNVYRWLIPKNLTLHFHQGSRSWGEAIKGEGDIDKEYRHRVFMMAEAAEKKLEQERAPHSPMLNISIIDDLNFLIWFSSTLDSLPSSALYFIRKSLTVSNFDKLYHLLCLPLESYSSAQRDEFLLGLKNEAIQCLIQNQEQLLKLLELPIHLFSEKHRTCVIAHLFNQLIDWMMIDSRQLVRLISFLSPFEVQVLQQEIEQRFVMQQALQARTSPVLPEREQLKPSVIGGGGRGRMFQLPPIQRSQTVPTEQISSAEMSVCAPLTL